jgi:subtilisin-like proprotein convertase family protein
LAALGAGLLAACDDDPKHPGPYPGIQLSASDVVTSEGGAVVGFDVSLNTPPSADVTVSLTSGDSTEGSLMSPGGSISSTVTVTFTPQDYAVPQTVQVVPLDDVMVDGNVTYTITIGVLATTDPSYGSIPGSTMSVTNADDDTAGVTLNRTTTTTSESGTTSSFTVSLNTQPTATVTIPVTSLDASEGLVRGGSSPTTYVQSVDLTFTTSNFGAAQTVVIRGANDSIDDGNQTYGIQVGPATGATEYAALTPQSVSVTNTDDDTAGITVVASATPLVTSENGTTATFTVRLNSEPPAETTLPVTSGNVAEGSLSSGSQNGLETVNLTFTSASWSTPQTVTVTGQDEVGAQVGGDNVSYDVTVGPATGAPEYVALAAQAVSVLNVDNDTPAIVVPEAGSTALQTRESGTGTTATFSLRLNKAPTANVVVPVTPGDATEGKVQGGSSPTVPVDSVNVTFTTADWQTPQTITVVGQADYADDGNQTYTIAVGPSTSADTGFDGVSSSSPVSVTNIDTDVAGFTVSATALSHTEGGAVTTFTVRLNTIPSADVVIPVTSGNAAEGLVSGGSIGSAFGPTLDLTFTPANWQTVQTVSVKGPTDDVDDGNETYTITVGPPTSSDPAYSALAARFIGATNVDVDTAGLTVTPQTGLATTEVGGTATFTVRLNSKPTADVSISVSANDVSETLVSTSGDPAASASLTFTSTDWSTPRTVTVTGQQDTILDGARPFAITVGPPTSTDAVYSALAAKTVTGSNADDEVGVSEGAIDSPVAAALPYEGQVGSSAPSYYVLTSIPAGAYVAVAGPTEAVTFTVDGDGTYGTPICAEAGIPLGGTGSCQVPAGGTVYVRVGTVAPAGAGYTLDFFQRFTSTDVPRSITDFSTVNSTLSVAGGPSAITKVTVTLNITHTYDADLDVHLIAPDGTQIELTTDNGGTGNGYSNVTFDDGAASSITTAAASPITGTYRPEQALSGLNGKNANGTWTLRVHDDADLDSGSLTAWSITVR